MVTLRYAVATFAARKRISEHFDSTRMQTGNSLQKIYSVVPCNRRHKPAILESIYQTLETR